MGVGLTHAWRVVAASVEGTSHQSDGRGCQDAHAVRLLGDDVAVLVVADGAGSARRARDGAALAVDAAADAVVDAMEDGEPADDDGWRQMVAGALVAARARLEHTASQRAEESPNGNGNRNGNGRHGGDPLSDLATTLAVVVAGHGTFACAQVGDAAVVIATEGGLVAVGEPPGGEYLNETTFITSRRWADETRIDVLAGDTVRAVAVLSDGLQLLALDLARRAPHPPFFEPLYRFAASEDASADDLAAFLASDRVCERTDDDKTLVLAVRTST